VNRSRLAGWSLIGAAPLLLAAELVRSDHSEATYASQLADVAANRDPELISAALFLLAAVLLIPASAGMATLVRDRGARLTTIGGILLGIGALWIAAGRAMYGFLLYALASPDLAHGIAVAALEGIADSSGFAIFLPLLLALILAPILLTIGLWRAGLAHWWIAPVWLVAAVAYVQGLETSRLGSLVSFGPMMVVLAYLGARSMRGTRTSRQRKLDHLVAPETSA
jgi:hypothetical protein